MLLTVNLETHWSESSPFRFLRNIISVPHNNVVEMCRENSWGLPGASTCQQSSAGPWLSMHDCDTTLCYMQRVEERDARKAKAMAKKEQSQKERLLAAIKVGL